MFLTTLISKHDLRRYLNRILHVVIAKVRYLKSLVDLKLKLNTCT